MLRASDDGLHRKPHWRPSRMLCGCWRGRRASCQLTVQVTALRRAVVVASTLATSKASMARLTDRDRRRPAHRKAVASPAISFSDGLLPAFACKKDAAVPMARGMRVCGSLNSRCNNGVSHPCSHTCLRFASDKAFEIALLTKRLRFATLNLSSHAHPIPQHLTAPPVSPTD